MIIDLQRNGEEANTLGEYLKVPVVTMVPQSKPEGKYTISMYPSISTVNSAIVDALLRYKITESILLYEGTIYHTDSHCSLFSQSELLIRSLARPLVISHTKQISRQPRKYFVRNVADTIK